MWLGPEWLMRASRITRPVSSRLVPAGRFLVQTGLPGATL